MMNPPGDESIRIPFTTWQRIWLFMLLLLPIASIAAAITLEPSFLAGILATIAFGSWFGYRLGRSPGKIEFVTQYSFFISPRGENFSFLYAMDWKERDNPPDSKYILLEKARFRWSKERLEIIVPHECIYIGSGPTIYPIRDWLIQHGVQPK